ncbi:uncharacterized protein LOC121593740 [Anopheles merus]|uniref:uncharacterized protein LOC121593740 n=1 Tax=Anopheles merus TaxID=30066 RepID=UPI001BE4BA8F|nr:uncharacterized protein LOC121593740 [Anopheles merus]
MCTLQLLLFLASITILSNARPGQGLEIEHPHSFSTFKRGVMLGDVSYSYSSTDMGSPESGRYKTVTVIKNIAIPKPTSTMFSDRSEHFYDSVEKGSSGSGSSAHKKRTHVEYWPPKEDNQVAHRLKLEPSFHKASSNTQHRPKSGSSHTHQRHHSRQEKVATPKPTYKPAEIKEQSEEDPKHPIDLLELAKSAVKTLTQKAKTGGPGENTGPVTFPSDGMMMKKKQNGVVSVAQEYTSIVTEDPTERQPIVSKLRTKVDLPTKAPSQSPYYSSSSPTSTTTASSSEEEQEIPLKDFEQSEYVFNHKTGTFEFRKASKAPKAVQEYLRASPYGQKGDQGMGDGGASTYSSPSELLFAELHNAVSTRNVTMIKALASQLEETFNIGQLDFESLKTEAEMEQHRTTEDSMMMMMMMAGETTTAKAPFDFGYGNYGETTTMEYQDPTTEAIMPSTTVKAPIMMMIPTTTTKKPLRYIAPKLRGFKRFSSKRQNN